MIGTPSLGRIVHYRLTADDQKAILERRTRARMHQAPGFNAAYAGDVYPATVVRTYAEYKSISAPVVCNLQVFLDGPDTLWVTSRGYSVETEGCWFWPPRQDMTQEGR